MPKRTDLKSILIIGAGPIVIGQACEFDYSGAQACKALKEEGYRVILVNSNPATIMHLAELALDFAGKVLAPGGDFLVKVFQGRDFQPYVQQLRGLFGTVKVRKPPASRQRSPELYLLARTFNSG